MNFIAQTWPVDLCKTSYTLPKEPWPSFLPFSYVSHIISSSSSRVWGIVLSALPLRLLDVILFPVKVSSVEEKNEYIIIRWEIKERNYMIGKIKHISTITWISSLAWTFKFQIAFSRFWCYLTWGLFGIFIFHKSLNLFQWFYSEVTLESVPGTKQYLAMRVKVVAQGSTGCLWYCSNPVMADRLRVRCTTHFTMPRYN